MITLLLFYPLTFLFSFSIFILIICSSGFFSSIDNMYVPGDFNILLIYVCDL